MTPETRNFIVSLFEWYAESPSGKEPENAKALGSAWDEIDNLAPIEITKEEDWIHCRLCGHYFEESKGHNCKSI